MKRLKIGFLAVIGILAMSFTMVEYSGIHNTAKATSFDLDPTDCFRPLALNPSQGKYTCPQSRINVVSTNCTSATNSYDKDFAASAFHLFSLNTANFIENGSIGTACPGNTTFCCFTIVEDTNPLDCTGTEEDQPTIDVAGTVTTWKIADVFCLNP